MILLRWVSWIYFFFHFPLAKVPEKSRRSRRRAPRRSIRWSSPVAIAIICAPSTVNWRRKICGTNSTNSAPRWSSPKLEGKLALEVMTVGGGTGWSFSTWPSLAAAPANGYGPRRPAAHCCYNDSGDFSHWNLTFPRLDLDKAFTQWATICRVGFQIWTEHMC